MGFHDSGAVAPAAVRNTGKRKLIRDGHGSEAVTDFLPGRDLLAFDMAEITCFADLLDRLNEVDGNATLTFDNGDVLTLVNVAASELRIGNVLFGAGPVCLSEGTLLYTERGEIAVEDLRPDDIVWTKDHGWQAIRLVTFEEKVFNGRDDPDKPVLIPEGALGFASPHSDLVISPVQRILRINEETGEEVLVPALEMVGKSGIRQMRGKRRVRYHGVLMQRHSVIQAAGCWVESMPMTSQVPDRHRERAGHLIGACRGMEPMRRVEKIGVRNRRLKSV